MAESRAKGDGTRPLVLVVDDSPDNRALTAEILAYADFRVEEAATGTGALEKAKSLLPDVILLDLALPEVDGWEVIRRLKSDPRTRRCRIIAYTAHALSSLTEKAREAGCDSVLTKPCKSADLIGAVEKMTVRSGALGG